MKKLSIEEKAKRYDEAIERAKEMCTTISDRAISEYIFPELKESEDEKTKRILHSISSKISFHLRDIFTEEEFQCFDAWSNAWLEKQEQVKALTDEDERIRKAIIALLNTTVKGKKLYSIADTTRSEMVNWLEKQEKKNEQSPKWKGIKDLEAAILAAHPTFEQKPANKIEPKFKVGDIV